MRRPERGVRIRRVVTIRQIVHYDETDTRFERDYFSITLKDGLGETIAVYGDAYHDRGEDKVDGFVAGVEWATGKQVVVTREDIADGQT